MARKLKPGVHFVNIKGKRRKVKVLANGKWKFMKMGSGTSPKKTTKRKTSNVRTTTRRKRTMARKKRRSGRRRTAVRVLPILAMLGAVTDVTGYNNWGPLQGAVTGIRQQTAALTGMAGPNLMRAAVMVGGAGLVSGAVTSLSPQSKLTVGKYVVRL